MAVVTLTGTSASNQNWQPGDLLAGTTATVETWGAGSGGSGGSTSFRSGGAGGAYATTTYTITPNDVTNGVTYFLNAGSSGTAAANSTAGPNTWFSQNNLNLHPNTGFTGAVVGTPGTLPSNWSTNGDATGVLSHQVVGMGFDPTTGLNYIDLRLFGTSTGTFGSFITCGNLAAGYGQGFASQSPSTQYTMSGYIALVGGSHTNVTSVILQVDAFNSGTYVASYNGSNIQSSITSSLQRFSATYTTSSTTINQATFHFTPGFSAGAVLDFTWRLAGFQIETGSSASAWKSTPGYCLAAGGGATSGTTGGTGGTTASSRGATTFAGGSGATRAQGGGGGGSAGASGAGTTATTGTGGKADNNTINAGTSNVEGGGGGTASAGTAGSPGGGGAANTSTGSGSSGGRGQIRITYTSAFACSATNNFNLTAVVTAIQQDTGSATNTIEALTSVATISDWSYARNTIEALTSVATISDWAYALNNFFPLTSVVTISDWAYSINTIESLTSVVSISDWAYARNTIEALTSVVTISDWATATNTIEALTSVVTLTQYDQASATNSFFTLTSVATVSDWATAQNTFFVINANAVVTTASNLASASINFYAGYSRASSATYFDATGTLQVASNNYLRIDHDRSTPFASRGPLIEASSFNYIPNPRAEGATPGTPGTLPTGWYAGSNAAGVSFQVVGTGYEQGIPYLDIRFSGTPATSADCFAGFWNISPFISNPADNTTWTLSAYINLQAGSLTSISFLPLTINIYDSTNTTWQSAINNSGFTPTTAALATQFVTCTGAVPTAGEVLQGGINPLLTAGVAVDVTFRLGAPQLELGSLATSRILPPINAYAQTARATDLPFTQFIDVAGPQSALASPILIQSDQASATNNINITSVVTLIQYDQASATNTIEALTSVATISDWAYATNTFFTLTSVATLTQYDQASATNTIEALTSVVTISDWAYSANTIESLTSSVNLGQSNPVSATDTLEALTSVATISDWAYSVNTIEVLSSAVAVAQEDTASATNTLFVLAASASLTSSTAASAVDTIEAITSVALLTQFDQASSTDTCLSFTSVASVANPTWAYADDDFFDLSATATAGQSDPASAAETLEALTCVASAGQQDLVQAVNTIEAITAAIAVMNPLPASGTNTIEVLTSVGQLDQFDLASATDRFVPISSVAQAVLGNGCTGLGFFVLSSVAAVQNPLPASAVNTIEALTAVAAVMNPTPVSATNTITYFVNSSLDQFNQVNSTDTITYATVANASNPTPASATQTILALAAVVTAGQSNLATAANDLTSLSSTASVQNPLPAQGQGTIGWSANCTAQSSQIASSQDTISYHVTSQASQSDPASASDIFFSLNAAAFARQSLVATTANNYDITSLAAFRQVVLAHGICKISYTALGAIPNRILKASLARQVWFDKDDRYIYWPSEELVIPRDISANSPSHRVYWPRR